MVSSVRRVDPGGISLTSVFTFCLALIACGPPDKGPGLSLRLSASPTPRLGCVGGDGQVLPTTALGGQGGSLRLSVVRRLGDGTRSFVCDSVSRIPEERPSLDLGSKDDPGIVEIYAEWFDPTGARAGSGMLPELTGQDKADLTLYRAASWSCPEGTLFAGRAFHSATLLPWGEVLVLGGISQLPEAGIASFELLNSVEVFDPKTSRFVKLEEEQGVIPKTRAFHQAAVLDASADQVRVLVAGGVTAPLRRAALSGAPSTPTLLRFSPLGTTQVAGAEVLTYDRKTRKVIRQTLSEFDKVAFAGALPLPTGGLFTVGGASFPAGRETEGLQSKLVEHLNATLTLPPPSNREQPDPVVSMIQPWMIAPSVTLFSEDAIVLGAARSLPAAMMPSVRLTALRISTKTGRPGALEMPAGSATIFHTATLLAKDTAPQILVTGGFVMEPVNPIQARQPPPASLALRVYPIGGALAGLGHRSLTPPGAALSCGAAEPHYRPAGFEAASATFSGQRALITGGTPTASFPGCVECEPGDEGTVKLLCALRQAVFYDARVGTVVDAPSLAFGRMGHRQTGLLDGSILLSGGLTRPGGDVTLATREVEVYAPRAANDADDVDDPLVPLLKAQGLARKAQEAVRPCRTF